MACYEKAIQLGLPAEFETAVRDDLKEVKDTQIEAKAAAVRSNLKLELRKQAEAEAKTAA